MTAKVKPSAAFKRPKDPLLRAADTALRRAAKKAQERALAMGSADQLPASKTGSR